MSSTPNDKTAPKQKRRGEPIAFATPDFLKEQKAKLRELLPNAFSEGKIDWEKLRDALGESFDEGPERYTFSWAGKRKAIQELQEPSWGTLTPATKESVDFESTNNIFIEGENLEVLKLLYKGFFGRVKLIYVDPPYNTGNDFVYPDDFADPKDAYLKITGQKDAEGNLLTSNPETSGRYHSAWLSMMYPRLFIARQLLSSDGAIFVSIDEHEVHNLRLLMNEIFGEEAFVADVSVVNNMKGRNDRKNIATAHEHLLIYANPDFISYGLKLSPKQMAEYGETDEQGEAFQWRDLRKRGGADTKEARPRLHYSIFVDPSSGEISLEADKKHSIEVLPMRSDGVEGCWRWKKEKVAANVSRVRGFKVEGKGKWNISYRVYLQENGKMRVAKPKSIWIGSQFSTDAATKSLRELLPQVTDMTPKPVAFLKAIIQQATDDDDVCLDLFSGSATAGHAVFEVNREEGTTRRIVMCQLPEPLDPEIKIDNGNLRTVADIGKERLRRVISRMNARTEGELTLDGRDTPEDLGFAVFKLAPSNFKPWPGLCDSDPAALAATMELFNDPLADGWKAENVIYEVAIKEGFGLPIQIEKSMAIKTNAIFIVTDRDKEQAFRICLDDEVKTSSIKNLGLSKDDLFVCRDIAIDDKTAANLALQCRLKTI